MTEVCKVIKGIDNVDSQCLCPMVGVSKTREHHFKLRGRRFKGVLRGNFSHTNSRCYLKSAARGVEGGRKSDNI